MLVVWGLLTSTFGAQEQHAAVNRTQALNTATNYKRASMGEVNRDGIPLGFTTFVSADGAKVTVYYLKANDRNVATKAFRQELDHAIRVVKRTEKRDSAGNVVGEWAQIVVRGIAPETTLQAVTWTDGPSFHEMISVSLKNVLELEKAY
jgi:hypothetical protein